MDELPPVDFPSPPQWSLNVGDLGKFLVIAATVLFVVATFARLFEPKAPILKKVGNWAFGLGCVAIFGTFASLGALFIGNRFEYEYVWGHADSKNTIPYRIAGIWSGQEGSFLLWAACSAAFGWPVLRLAQKYQRWYTVIFSVFLGSLTAILAYESPFRLNMMNGLPIVPPEGTGLAPSLQNYWVTIHPPTIFLGFGSLTVLFALAFAALFERDYDTWIPIVRPWAIVSMTLVGVGLCMGGFWAYETLGWGGFWMWDPVENTSFVPWCFAAAFVHGIIVQTTRKRWQISNLLMGALPFLSFVYGTFLTRSGFLADASVHSFAQMDRSALRLLIGMMGLFTIGFTSFWIVRAVMNRKAEGPESAVGLNREGFYRTGALLLIGMAVATMLGMSVPLFMALSGRKPAVVDEHTYHLVLPWIFVPLMLVMATAPFVSWRTMPVKDFVKRCYSILCLTVGFTGLILLGFAITPLGRVADLTGTVAFAGGMQVKGMPWIMTLVALCVFTLISNVWRITELTRASKLALAPFITHIGVCVLMAGLIISRGFERKGEALVMENHPGRALGYAVVYKGQTSTRYDRHNEVKFDILDAANNGKVIFTASPGLYYVKSPDGMENPMVWPHIQRHFFYDVYVTLNPPQKEAGQPIQLQAGESADFGGLKLTYKKMTREGEPGKAGTKFGALVEVSDGKTVNTVNPKMELGFGGPPIQHPAKLDSSLNLQMVGMDAASGGVTLQVEMNTPMYPIEIYHKPLTILVWGGTGIMTLGGFLSALYRKRSRRSNVKLADDEINQPSEEPAMAIPATR